MKIISSTYADVDQIVLRAIEMEFNYFENEKLVWGYLLLNDRTPWTEVDALWFIQNALQEQ